MYPHLIARVKPSVERTGQRHFNLAAIWFAAGGAPALSAVVAVTVHR
jgi:hypothetical protein